MRVTVNVVNTPLLLIHRDYETQKPPFRRPMPIYNNRVNVTRVIAGPNGYPANRSTNDPLGLTGARGVASSIAYRRMMQELHSGGAQWGSTLTSEARSSYGTVVTNLVRVATAARHIAKLRIGAAAETLGLPIVSERVTTHYYRSPKSTRSRRSSRTVMALADGRQIEKTVAGGWLLWSFGAKPLIDDINTAMQVLTNELPWGRVSGRGTSYSEYRRQVVYPGYPKFDAEYHKVRDFVRQSVWVRVKNPNLYLAARLGLINPVQMVLEGLPWSFVVDWFSNLSDVISSWTDFTGLETRDPLVNQLILDDVLTSWYYPSSDPPEITTSRGRYTYRSPGLQPPRLRFAYERFQWQRGLNAIALLVGLLPTTKR